MKINHAYRGWLLASLFFASLFVTGGLGACADGETSTCEVGGACEQQQLNSCTCCPAEQIGVCQTNVSDACATGNLEVSGTAESCAQFNSDWDTVVTAGQDPCAEVDADEITDFCDQAVSLFD